MCTPSISTEKTMFSPACRSALAVVIGADPGDQEVAELVLARPGEGQARGDRTGVAVVGVGVADRQQRRRHACRPRSRSTGGHGSVMTVASLDPSGGSRHGRTR